jgi:orotidine-5'-phosphate decarboxylase
VELARESGSGLFALALTSNPEGASVQRAVDAEGRTVAQSVLAQLAAENAGAEPLGSFGAVVGATLKEVDEADLAINGPLLAPGVGAQGATMADIPRVFGAAAPNVVPSVSRDVLRHGPSPQGLRDAAQRFVDEVRAAVRP